MNVARSRCSTTIALALAFVAVCCRNAAAGPPYQTDDPEPVAYRNYEIYMGFEGAYGSQDNETSLPFVEINYGPLPNVQVAASLPLSISASDGGAYRYGAGNVELGVKYRFVPESSTRPQISFYPSIGIPTGIESPEVDGSTQTLFLPVWAQKTLGRVTLFGGGGWERNAGPDGRNFWSGGLAGTYAFSHQVNAGLEIYSSGADKTGERGSTSLGIGMNDDYSKIHSILFSVGTSIAGERSFHGYLAYEVRLGPQGLQGDEP